MKLTQEQLKNLIREELEKAKIEEGFFDFFTGGKKKKAPPRIVRGDDPRYHYDQTKYAAASLNLSDRCTRKSRDVRLHPTRNKSSRHCFI